MEKKRKLEESEDSAVIKRSKRENVEILDLSDDVLLYILSYLPTSDLLNLAETCQRLGCIAEDESLWKKIQMVGKQIPVARLRKVLKYLTAKTVSIKIGGAPGDRQSITPAILQSFGEKCPNLDELVLEGCDIDAESIQLTHIPKTAKRLGLRSCNVVNIDPKKSYLYDLENLLPELEELDLTNAAWLSNHSLLAICKSQSLKAINFKGCSRLGECIVYSSLATRFGFRNVTHIDLRDTHVGDSEVPCFGRLPKLTHLYFGQSTEQSLPDGFESNGKITDRGVISLCLSEMENERKGVLKVLTLMKSEITDKSLGKLAMAFALEKLDLSGCTHVTKDGIQTFITRRPACQVIC